jgi:hypothetical protein
MRVPIHEDDRPTENAGRGPFAHELEAREEDGVTLLHHAPSDVRFLVSSHGFRRGAAYRYDAHGHDVSVRYTAGSGSFVSTYVFPFRAPRTPELFDEVFGASVADMLGGAPPCEEMDERRVGFAHATAGVVAGRRCEVRGPVWKGGSGRIGHGLVELYVRGAWLLKIRATFEPGARGDVEGFLGAWLRASSFGAR